MEWEKNKLKQNAVKQPKNNTFFHSRKEKDLNLNEAFKGMVFLSHGSPCMDLTHNWP